MLARNSVRELRVRPVRTVLTVAGVAVATAMLADMLMLGGGIQRSFGELLESRGYELRVSPKGTLPFDTEATIPAWGALGDSVGGVAGVERVAPVLAMSVSVEVVGGGEGVDGAAVGEADGSREARRTLALGLDAGNRSLYEVVAGDGPGAGEVLVDARLAEVLGVRLGGRLRLAIAGEFGTWGRSASVRVSGTGDFVFATARDMLVALPLADLQALSGLVDEVSFAMIRVGAGVDPEAVRAGIAAVADRVEVVTLAGISDKLDERLSYFRQVAVILGSVSLFVAALLIGTITAVSVSERLGVIAAVRAIGVARRRVVGDLVAESVVLAVVGGGIGIGLGVVVAGYLESILAGLPGLPAAVRFFVLRPGSLATAYGLVIVSGAVAGLVPALRATGREVTELLHREEP